MSAPELMATGLLMGAVHVLTGPDHLSALATLCGTTIRRPDGHCKRSAFLLGVRWGLGHSVGLVVVGGALIAMEETSGENIAMDDRWTTMLEGAVGAFMLALGAYGLFRAQKHRRENEVAQEGFQRRDSSSMVSLTSANVEAQVVETGKSLRQSLKEIDDSIVNRMEDVLETDSRHSSDALSRALSTGDLSTDELFSDQPDSYLDGAGSCPSPDRSIVTISSGFVPSSIQAKALKPKADVDLMAASSLVAKHTDHSVVDIEGWANGPIRDDERCCGLRNICISTPGLLALAAGVLHGVAGPAGVLGVIPAVQLRDAKLASAYLGTFCVSSTLVMGCFAACYGSLSEWLAGGASGNRVYMVEAGSALLSVSVGIIWLVLLGLGKLDEVFP
ncbi:hypothetical protein ACHAXT_011158 [Thalassiosira profunda]